ncbi:fibronectin type III domain-containing protein [Leptothrix discophora]|uniref:Fibronectin type III domain-containing protein n=1 Tax=Leptothrix discophora TaxID=89 RepID=A0ABT9G1Y4_LEPDI|nr:fibronectin type III domain-containing protein [Leptothrix discophora]MDP4300500.1 fibronectin type III domain-containing protein [Leptothrix discophora]
MRIIPTLLIGIVLALAGCGSGDSPTATPPATGGPDIPSPQVPQVILQVSPFGEGTVSADSARLVCTDGRCSASVAAGSQVTLKAQAAADWVLDHWTGCDSTVDDRCTVTVTTGRTAQPFFVRTTAPQVHADVVVLSDATLDALVSDTRLVLTFTAAATQLASVDVGAVIVSGRGNGFARRVLKKIVLPGGNYLLDTLQASLSDIVLDGTLVGGAATTGSGGSGIARVQSLGPGVTLANRARPLGATSEFNLDVPLNAANTSRLTGKISIEWNPEVALDFRMLGGLKEAKLIINPTVRPDVTFIRGPDPEDTAGEWPVDLGIFTLTPIYLQVGPVPVVFVPTVRAYVTAHAKGGVQVNFTSGYSLQGSYGAHYRKGSGWDGVSTTSLDGHFAPVGALKFEGELGISVYMGVAVYDVIGPFIQVGPYVRATGEINTDSTAGLCTKFRADLGIAAKVGGNFKVLNWYESKFELTLIDQLIKNLTDVQGAACHDTQPPTKPGSTTVVASGLRSISLKWEASTDEGGMRGYQVLRDDLDLATTGHKSYQDTRLEPGREHCYRIVAIDLSGNRSVPGDRVCATTPANDRMAPSTPSDIHASAISTTAIHLSWQASTDDSGVAGYVVSTEGRSLRTLTDTALDIGKLQPSTSHCYVITAFDAAGNVSPPSAPVCVSTLPPERAAWTLQLACVGQSYNISNHVDLDADSDSLVNVTDQAMDYSGTPLAYHLHGTFDPETKVLHAQIDWAFSNSSDVRLDTFTATLSMDDTGNLPLTQVHRTGCDGHIRFTRNTP